jgi:hypothetical protein
MTSNNLPTYVESETNLVIETALRKNLDDLRNYAYDRGNYLLDDPLFRLFEATYTTSNTLDSVLQELTIPTSDQNIKAIRKLRGLQRVNYRQTLTAYERIISPRLLVRIRQPNRSGRQDSPILRVSTPPRFNTPVPSSSQTHSHPNPNNRQRRCYKCRQTTHEKCHCPRYRCPHCRHLQPGHFPRFCPDKPISDSLDYDYHHDYDPDGNLNGEC